ncbi:MAG: membrane lipoprotein lipid attachment site-containing protein [Alphaproteobacteria bacterium]
MKKMFLLLVGAFFLSGCSEIMTTKDAFTTTGDTVSSTVKATTNTTKSSTDDKGKNWEYDE